MCAKFQITGFQYGPRNSATWINQSQPSNQSQPDGKGQPWYFSSNVLLHNTTIDPNSPVSPAVQARIKELQQDPSHAFTIQKLFLDLSTAILLSSPKIEGIPTGWPVWNLITTVFLDAYIAQLRKKGDPVLSYSFTVTAPRPATLQLGAVSRECCPLQQPNGQPIPNPTPTQLDAAELIYLGSTSTTAPIPVPFAWNWVEANEVTLFSGVQAVRRDVFFTFFAGLLNGEVGPLCLDTKVALTHSGENFTVQYSSGRSGSPTTFRPVSPILPPAGDGFTTLLALNFSHPSHDDSTSSTHLVEIWGDFNYTLTGSVAVSGNRIRVQVRAQAFMSFAHREVFVNYTDLEGADYYDKTLTVVYALGVDQNGGLQVTETHDVADHSAKWQFNPKGILGITGAENDVKDGVTSVSNNLSSYLDSAFSSYVYQMTAVINGYRGWVFPGNDAFTFRDLSFSVGNDLIAKLTYLNPN